jgi:Protein of unknown function (DUF3108)
MVFAMKAVLRGAQLLLLGAVALHAWAARNAMAPPARAQAASGKAVSNGSPASGPTLIHPPPANHAFPLRELFRYSVEWHLMNAGTATLSMQAAGSNHTSVLTADSAGLVSVLYPIHDRLESSFDPHTFCTLSVQKHTLEGPRRREVRAQFDYQRGQTIFEQKDIASGQIKKEQHPIPKCVTDVMSGFYYVASLPLGAGAGYQFPISDGGPISQIVAQVEGREQVKVQAGTYQAVRVSLVPVSGPTLGKGKLWLWYTDDGRRVLVQMKAKVKWGTVTFRLTQIEAR